MSNSTTGQTIARTQKITILGSTGSIGVSTLDVIARHPNHYSVFALSAHSRVNELAEQCRIFRPRYAVMPDAPHAATALKARLVALGVETEVLAATPDQSASPLEFIASHADTDIGRRCLRRKVVRQSDTGDPGSKEVADGVAVLIRDVHFKERNIVEIVQRELIGDAAADHERGAESGAALAGISEIDFHVTRPDTQPEDEPLPLLVGGVSAAGCNG